MSTTIRHVTEDDGPDERYRPLAPSPSTLAFLRRAILAHEGPDADEATEVDDGILAVFVDERLRLMMATRADVVQAGELRETWSDGGSFAPVPASMLAERVPTLPGEGEAFRRCLHADLARRVAEAPYGILRARIEASGDGLVFEAERHVPPTRKLGRPVVRIE